MLSVILPIAHPEPAVVDTLAALVPAVADGLLRDVAMVASAGSDFVRDVADAAGCTLILEATGREGLVRRGAAAVKGPWALVVEPGLVPGGDWIAEVRDFIEDADPMGRQAAIFSLNLRGGLALRLQARLRNLTADLLGRAHPLQGLVAPVAALVSPGGGLRLTRLSAPVYDRRGRSKSV